MWSTVGGLTVSLTVLANLVIALIVFRNNRRSASHVILSILAIVLALWAIFNFIALSPGSESIRLFWVRIVMLVTTPLAPLIFFLASAFPNPEFKVNKKLVVCILIFNLVTASLALSPYMFTQLTNLPDGSFQLYPGWAILIYAVNLLGFLTLGFIELLRKYKKSTGTLRKQLGLFVFGIIFSFTLMTVTNFIAVVVFKTIKLTYLGPTFTLIMISFISYAIIKHGLLNIKILATQLFVLALWVILFSKLFVYNSIGELIVDLIIFGSVLIFGVLLIKSVVNEVKHREELQELTEKLRALDKQKDEFISMAAHELRSPLTAIKGYVSMIMEGDTGDIPQKAREFLADSSAVTERLIRLVNNMLNVSRIEEGRIVYQMEETDLIRVLQETFYSERVEADRKGLKFLLNVPDGLRDDVYVDPDRIREVAGNIVSNAVKFTEKGEININISNPDKDTARVEVVDTGPGISKEEQKKLFQKFYRAETTAGKTFGTGLGLYITRLLVEKFGGKIGVESEPNKGSNFWFELPLSKGVK